MNGKLPVPNSPATAHAATERRARRFWVGLVVMLLGLQVAIGALSVTLAVRDPSVAVTPDYYEQAVNWDATRRARLRTQQLGWKLDYIVLPAVNGEQFREMRVVVQTPAGDPVSGLSVSGQVFHHARGNDVYRVELEEIQDGIYRCQVPIMRSGFWQVDMRMEGMSGLAADYRAIMVQ